MEKTIHTECQFCNRVIEVSDVSETKGTLSFKCPHCGRINKIKEVK